MSILLTKDTRFIIQGITGREAINLTRENLDYGAKIVGGVTPGRAGRDVYGVPVYDSVRDAVAANGGSIEGSIVSVPPKFTQDAMIEALENGIKLIVVVTENVPRKQVAEAVERTHHWPELPRHHFAGRVQDGRRWRPGGEHSPGLH